MRSRIKNPRIILITVMMIPSVLEVLGAQDKAALEREATQLRTEVHSLKSAGKNLEAIPKAERLVLVAEQLFGQNHPTIATLLENLSDLYQAVGRESDAQDARLRVSQINAINMREQPNIEVNRLIVKTKGYVDRGDFRGALTTSLEAERILNDIGLATSLQYAVVIGEIGRCYEGMGEFEKAEVHYKRSASIAELKGRSGQWQLISVLNNLGLLYWKMKLLDDAEHKLARALALRQKLGGAQSALLVPSLINLGLVYDSQGKYNLGRESYLKARNILISTYGDDHPWLSSVYNNLAALSWIQQDVEAALSWQEQANYVVAKNITDNIVLGSERQKHLYMAKFLDSGNASISLSFGLAKGKIRAGQMAFNSVLQRKGRVMDAISQSLERVRASLSQSDRQLFEEFVQIQKNKAEILYKNNTTEHLDSRSKQSFDQGRLEALQVFLGERSTAFRDIFQQVTLEQIQSALPAASALIEFVLYEPRRPSKDGARFLTDPQRYAAYMLEKSGKIYWLDLGEKIVLDRLISDFQRGLSNPRSTYVKRVSLRLYQKIISPLEAFLSETSHVFIAPDGALNLIPFSAIVNEEGQFLAERYSFSYCSSGRDLLRETTGVQTPKPPVIIADPDYGRLKNESVAPCTDADRLSTRSFEEGFQRLCGTRLEALEISKILPGSTLLMGTSATETAIKMLRHPRILHIATHGFYLTDVLSSARKLNSDVPESIRSGILSQLDIALLGSGLVFAGANARTSGNDDGILTALEAIGLDLSGTELVVMSACETGLGEILAGEGVFGLRRALVLAGAESQIMGLWKVSDTATASLMARYYQLLKMGRGRSEALHQAQLELIKGNDIHKSHPYYWASFVLSGAWKPIRAGIAASQ